MQTVTRVAIGLVTVLSLVVSGATSALAAGITVSPNSGAIGTTTSVSGNGFAATSTVRVFFNGSGGTLVGAESSDGSGNLPGINVVIPNVTGGNYQIFATDGSNTASVTFTVPSSLTLSPTSGGPGTGVTVSGTGFLSGEGITVGWDQANNQIATATASTSGAFATTFSVPTTSGSHTVFATGQSSGFMVSATFSVSGNAGGATITLSPTSGAAGITVSLSGAGFSASEHVDLAVDGGGVTSLTSDANGNFSTNLRLSSSLALGSHTITATGASSGHSASATFQVTSTNRSTTCGEDDDRPGNGFGDDNHCHTGPRGHQDRNDNRNNQDRGHGHGHGSGDDQGDDQGGDA